MSDKKSDNDYESIGRAIESVFETGYSNKWRVYRINFVRGVFFGLGTFLGGSLFITLILWILSWFTSIPFLGEVAQTIRDTIK